MCATELFATGFSNGAMMSNRVGCELAGTFKGIAPLDGPLQFGNGFDACTPTVPVSVIQFCGAADGVCNKGIDSTMLTWATDRAGELDLENDTVSKASNKHGAVSRMRTCEDGLKSGAAEFSKEKIDSSLAELQALQSEFADQVGFETLNFREMAISNRIWR